MVVVTIGSSCSQTALAAEPGDGARLEVMTVHVEKRRLSEDPRPAPTLRPELGEPLGTRGHRSLGERDSPDAVLGHDRLEVTASHARDDLWRPARHRVPVAAQRIEIDALAQFIDFRIV